MKIIPRLIMLLALAAPASAGNPYTDAADRLQAGGGDVYARPPQRGSSHGSRVLPPSSPGQFVPQTPGRERRRESYDPGNPGNGRDARVQAPGPGGQMLPTNSRQFGGNRVTNTPRSSASSLNQGAPYMSPLR